MGFRFGKERGDVVCLWRAVRIVNRSYEPIYQSSRIQETLLRLKRIFAFYLEVWELFFNFE